ncbi:hypothetical protein N309_13391, partial [Tinamus guttatus]
FYTVLDLKDAFFSIPLSSVSQPLFAFEWNDPSEGYSGQLRWTRLPQGFKNSPTIFDEISHKDLVKYRHSHPEATLLQSVDDLLLAAWTLQECQKATEDLLRQLSELGYCVSAEKAQICRKRVQYLGYLIEEGTRKLSASRVQAITQIPTPKTKKQVREFLGAAGYCRLWILGFAEMAKPLYQAVAGGDAKPLEWGPQEEEAFQQIKQALIQASALALPNISKPFCLYVH